MGYQFFGVFSGVLELLLLLLYLLNLLLFRFIYIYIYTYPKLFKEPDWHAKHIEETPVIFKSRILLHIKKRTFDQSLSPVSKYACEIYILKKEVTINRKLLKKR